MSTCLCVFRYICLYSDCLSTYLSMSLCVCLSICLSSDCWIVYLAICRCDCVFVCPVCLSAFRNAVSLTWAVRLKVWLDLLVMQAINADRFDDSLVQPCTFLRERWLNTTDYSNFTMRDVGNFSAQQTINFLAQLQRQVKYSCNASFFRSVGVEKQKNRDA